MLKEFQTELPPELTSLLHHCFPQSVKWYFIWSGSLKQKNLWTVPYSFFFSFLIQEILDTPIVKTHLNSILSYSLDEHPVWPRIKKQPPNSPLFLLKIFMTAIGVICLKQHSPHQFTVLNAAKGLPSFLSKTFFFFFKFQGLTGHSNSLALQSCSLLLILLLIWINQKQL